jgi:hypothetical protein
MFCEINKKIWRTLVKVRFLHFFLKSFIQIDKN